MITNMYKLPLSMAVFLSYDDYDGYTTKEKSISATSLLKPTKQILLSKRVPKTTSFDVSDNISSALGSAYHNAVENAWKSPELPRILEELKVPKKVRECIRVNPTEVTEDIIPIYLEQRSYRELNGWEISGKFDLIVDGCIEDIKSTSVYTYLKQNNAEKYILQGSIYRWLNPKLVTGHYIQINYLFTDWSANQARNTKGYPPLKIFPQKFPLKSLEETETFIKNKIKDIEKYMNATESEMPECTDEELWRTDPVWKYYSKPDAKKSNKNFDNLHDANMHLAQKGKGFVQEVKGKVRACAYCPAFSICEQKEKYINSGELVL